MASKSKSKQEEALQFLDDLESLSPASVPLPSNTLNATQTEEDAADAIAFLDEITQKSLEPICPLASTSHLERPLSWS
jgi:hypothetical protein